MATFYPPIDWTEHPLHAAAISGNRSKVELLIAEGADVNQLLHLQVNGPDLAGTPLHVALFNCHDDTSLYRGHHEVVKILLAAGADAHLCRMWEGTPLHDAARFGLTRIADTLISHGADVNSRGDYMDRTPLHLAATYGRLGMVDFLISKGAQIEAIAGSDDRADWKTSPYWRQYSGCAMRLSSKPGTGTPLQMAAREGHAQVVKELIEQGACLGIDTAIDLARRARGSCCAPFDEIITMLEVKQKSGT
jgi:ankyrin repeat protein